MFKKLFQKFTNKKKTEVLSEVDYNIIFDNKIVDGIPVEILEIGKLNVPTGRLVVCDPLVYYNIKPFSKTVSIGKYPIKIYIAKTKESGDRYAIAKLEFSKKKAARWVLATKDEEDTGKLKKGEFFGFPVDAGLGGFMDYKAFLEYENFSDDFMKKNPNGNIYDDVFAKEFKKNAINQDDPNDIGDWINFNLPNSDLNITMFQSGYGDGFYPVYWGIDENGEIASLVIDFFVLLTPDGE